MSHDSERPSTPQGTQDWQAIQWPLKRSENCYQQINTKRQASWLECLGTEQFVLCFAFNEQIRFVETEREKQPIPYKEIEMHIIAA